MFYNTRTKLVDPSYPVNRQHSLMQGTVAFYKALHNPGFRGITMRNLWKHGKFNGTLTGSPVWTGNKGMPNGLGSINLTGTAQYVNCGSSLNSPNDEITVAGWGRSVDTVEQYIFNKNFDTVVVPFSLAYGPQGLYGGVIDGFAWYDGLAGGWRTSGAVADYRGAGVWHFMVGTWKGGVASFYIDGKLDSSASPGGNRPTTGGLDATIGAYIQNIAYFPGQIDNVFLMSRALTAQQVREWYEETKTGCPTILNWYTPRSWHIVAGGTTFTQSLNATLNLSGASTTKQCRTTKTGTLATSGSLTKRTSRLLTGSLSLAGSLIKCCRKTFTGSLGLAGSLIKQCKKVLSNTLSLSGSLTAIRVVVVGLTATLNLAGSLSKKPRKALTATLSLSGSLIKRCRRLLTGALSLASSLIAAIVGTGGAKITDKLNFQHTSVDGTGPDELGLIHGNTDKLDSTGTVTDQVNFLE